MDTLATASNSGLSGNEPPASTGLLLSLQDLKDGNFAPSKKWKRKLCCLTACKKVTVPANRRVSYFKVRTEWYKIIREARHEPTWIPQTADVRLCSLHFTDDQFKILDKIYVKEKALPTEYLICDDDDVQNSSATFSTQPTQVVASVGANQKPINPKYIDMSLIHKVNNNNNNNNNKTTTYLNTKPRIKSTPQQKRISLVKTEMMNSAAKTVTMHNNNNNISTNTTTTTIPKNAVFINNNSNINTSSSITTTNVNFTDQFILPDQIPLFDQNPHQFLVQQHQQPYQFQSQQPHQVFIINNRVIQNNGQELLQQQQDQQESFDLLIQDPSANPNPNTTTNIPETITTADSSSTTIDNFTMSTPPTNNNSTTTTTTTTTTANNNNNITTNKTAIGNEECREISPNSIVLVNLKRRPGLAGLAKHQNSNKIKSYSSASSSPSSSLSRITNTANCAQSFSRIAASIRASKMMNNSSSSTTASNSGNMNNNNNNNNINTSLPSQDPLALASQPGTSSSSIHNSNNTNNNNNINSMQQHLAHMRKTRAASPTRKIEKLKHVNATLRTKVYQKTRQITRLDKRIANLKKQNKEVEDQLSLAEIEIAAVNTLKENPIMKTIVETEIQRQKLKKACTKGMRYTDEMKRLAVTIFKMSLPTYKFLRKAFAMPEESSIREWISGQDVSGTNVQNVIQDISLTRKPRVMNQLQQPQPDEEIEEEEEEGEGEQGVEQHDVMDSFTIIQGGDITGQQIQMGDVEGITVVHHTIDENEFDASMNVANNVSVVVMQDQDHNIVDYDQNISQVEMEVDGGTHTISVSDMNELILLSQ